MLNDSTITAKTSIDQLPDDTSTLKQMVLTLLGQIDDLSGQLYYLKRQLFGKKSEKLDPAQRLLFENLYEQIQSKLDAEKTVKPKKQKRIRKANTNHKGRNSLPADLPRETIDIEPAKEEQVCSACNSPKTAYRPGSNRST